MSYEHMHAFVPFLTKKRRQVFWAIVVTFLKNGLVSQSYVYFFQSRRNMQKIGRLLWFYLWQRSVSVVQLSDILMQQRRQDNKIQIFKKRILVFESSYKTVVKWCAF